MLVTKCSELMFKSQAIIDKVDKVFLKNQLKYK